jgi:RNA polymerase sigma factor (sigma-70 family)
VGSEVGFMACYRATFADVYAYAAMLAGRDRSAAEDVVHDVYLAALHRARSGELTELSSGYLVTAVRGRWIDRWRSHDREQRRLVLVARRDEVSDDPERDDTSFGMLAGLSDRERSAVVLRYVDDLPVADVAERLGIGTRAAESLLVRAMRRLRTTEVRDA